MMGTEINSASRISEVPAVNPPKNDPQLSVLFDIEEAFGPQQDTFSQNKGKMTGGQDDETAEQESTAEPSETPASNSGSTVNLFA